MGRYILRRLMYGLVTMFALSAVVFFLIQAGGGSPLDRLRGNPRMVPLIPQLTEFYGLDQPVMTQYLTWLRNYVTPERFVVAGIAPIVALVLASVASVAVRFIRIDAAWWSPLRRVILTAAWMSALWFAKSRIDFALDWSVSFRGNGSVWELVMGAAGASFRLGFAALVLSLLIGIPLGIYQAIRQYSFFDQLSTTASFLAFSVPVFILATGMQVLFALNFERWTGVKLFYVTGMTSVDYDDLGSRIQFGPIDIPSLSQFGDIVQHLALPALSLALFSVAGYARFQRAAMLEVIHSDYLRTAKAKGLARRVVVLKHALRNAFMPVVTIIAFNIAGLIGGSIITETIFGWPGVGRVYVDAINTVDYPVIMAVVMTVGIAIVAMNVIADVFYGVLDPRVRLN